MSFFFDPHPNEDFTYLGPTAEEADKWRRIGPLGKLYNIIVWVQGSPGRKQDFRNLSFGLKSSSLSRARIAVAIECPNTRRSS